MPQAYNPLTKAKLTLTRIKFTGILSVSNERCCVFSVQKGYFESNDASKTMVARVSPSGKAVASQATISWVRIPSPAYRHGFSL